MKNTIQSAINGLDLNHINSILPFENRNVWIWQVTYKQIGLVSYRLIMDLEIDGKRIILSTTNTTNDVITRWEGRGRLVAVYFIFTDNVDTLKEFISKQETEELKHFNIE